MDVHLMEAQEVTGLQQPHSVGVNLPLTPFLLI